MAINRFHPFEKVPGHEPSICAIQALNDTEIFFVLPKLLLPIIGALRNYNHVLGIFFFYKLKKKKKPLFTVVSQNFGAQVTNLPPRFPFIRKKKKSCTPAGNYSTDDNQTFLWMMCFTLERYATGFFLLLLLSMIIPLGSLQQTKQELINDLYFFFSLLFFFLANGFSGALSLFV